MIEKAPVLSVLPAGTVTWRRAALAAPDPPIHTHLMLGQGPSGQPDRSLPDALLAMHGDSAGARLRLKTSMPCNKWGAMSPTLPLAHCS